MVMIALPCRHLMRATPLCYVQASWARATQQPASTLSVSTELLSRRRAVRHLLTAIFCFPLLLQRCLLALAPQLPASALAVPRYMVRVGRGVSSVAATRSLILHPTILAPCAALYNTASATGAVKWWGGLDYYNDGMGLYAAIGAGAAISGSPSWYILGDNEAISSRGNTFNSGIMSITTYGAHTFAVDTNNCVYGWGLQASAYYAIPGLGPGDFDTGDDERADSLWYCMGSCWDSPTALTTFPLATGGTSTPQISVGNTHMCGVFNGQVVCWVSRVMLCPTAASGTGLHVFALSAFCCRVGMRRASLDTATRTTTATTRRWSSTATWSCHLASQPRR